jgi:hypothetical protein
MNKDRYGNRFYLSRFLVLYLSISERRTSEAILSDNAHNSGVIRQKAIDMYIHYLAAADDAKAFPFIAPLKTSDPHPIHRGKSPGE